MAPRSHHSSLLRKGVTKTEGLREGLRPLGYKNLKKQSFFHLGYR